MSRNQEEGTFKQRHDQWNRKRTLNRTKRKRTQLLARDTFVFSSRVRRILKSMSVMIETLEKCEGD